MSIEAIFGLQFVLSVLVIALLAKWTAAPWLESLPKRKAIFWLAVPHAFRHVGMVFELLSKVVFRRLIQAAA